MKQAERKRVQMEAISAKLEMATEESALPADVLQELLEMLQIPINTRSLLIGIIAKLCGSTLQISIVNAIKALIKTGVEIQEQAPERQD